MLVFALGFGLMFGGHVMAFLGSTVFTSLPFRVPYWWGYPLLYPVVAALLARRRPGEWMASALVLCLPPILYFLALGLAEGKWMASSGALWGALLTLIPTGFVARAVARRANRLGHDAP
jgi:hypothetical protein